MLKWLQFRQTPCSLVRSHLQLQLNALAISILRRFLTKIFLSLLPVLIMYGSGFTVYFKQNYMINWHLRYYLFFLDLTGICHGICKWMSIFHCSTAFVTGAIWYQFSYCQAGRFLVSWISLEIPYCSFDWICRRNPANAAMGDDRLRDKGSIMIHELHQAGLHIVKNSEREP